ncbi:MAG: hypothetical protein ACRDGL_05420 [Candidatus Limnocylindrales bacterium]
MPPRHRWPLLLAVLLAACTGTPPSATPSPSSIRTAPAPTASAKAPEGTPISPPAPTTSAPIPGEVPPVQVYLHYYTWWTLQHWHEKLGRAYPYAAATLPLPATVDASGCAPRAEYPGATIADLPSEGLYDQGQAATFDRHIAAAAAAGITGFLVSWQGIGTVSQTPDSSGYDSRLELLVERVDAYNAIHAVPFRLGLAFAAFGEYSRPAAEIIGDLTYFSTRYGHDPAFADTFSSKPLVMWLDSRKINLATVQAVSAALRPSLYLIGDETYQTWSRDAPYLDASSYYWSTQNPYQNASSGAQVLSLASQVRASDARWFAPFIAGYDKVLAGGSCVPRNGVETLDRLWQLNGASHPDAWFGISWNEFVEGTYLEPTVRYGRTSLDELRRLIFAAG